MRLLYTERTDGRDSALVDLAASAESLARTEALPSPGAAPLTGCIDAVCSRTKSAYVFGMLRQLVGDDALKQAISGWLAARPRRRRWRHRTRIPARSSVCLRPRPARICSGSSRTGSTGTPACPISPSSASLLARSNAAPSTTPCPRRTIRRAALSATCPCRNPAIPPRAEQGTTASRNQIGPRDGSWLVAVEVQNNGNAAAQVPVTVRAGSLQNSLPLRIAAHSRATIRVPFEVAPEEVWVNDGTTPEQRNYTHHRSLNGVDTGK